MTNVTLLEPATRTVPIGVRFWDAVEQKFIADGLAVNVRLASSQRRTPALANRLAIFYAQDLPFLAAAERGAGDEAYWASVAKLAFVVEVSDANGLFLPFSFPAELPAEGLLAWGCSAASPVVPSGFADGVPLFSAPSRLAPSMRATIRAQLQDATTGLPAAGAVLVATIAGAEQATGIADALGRVAVVFPYPEPEDFPIVGDPSASPPPGPIGSSLTGQSWPVTLAVRYAASAAPYPAYPDLCTTLSQPSAQLWGDTLGAALGGQTLFVGAELVLRSVNAATGAAMSVLLVK